MAEYIEREALLHDIEQSVVYTARGKITSAEMRGARKIIGRIKCAPAVEPIYIHEPTKSEFRRMAAQLGYEQVVRCKDCKHYEIHKPKVLENCERNGYIIPMKPYDFCSYGERKEGAD